eukprot:7389698-Prymnesium_polylepis.2
MLGVQRQLNEKYKVCEARMHLKQMRRQSRNSDQKIATSMFCCAKGLADAVNSSSRSECVKSKLAFAFRRAHKGGWGAIAGAASSGPQVLPNNNHYVEDDAESSRASLNLRTCESMDGGIGASKKEVCAADGNGQAGHKVRRGEPGAGAQTDGGRAVDESLGEEFVQQEPDDDVHAIAGADPIQVVNADVNDGVPHEPAQEDADEQE